MLAGRHHQPRLRPRGHLHLPQHHHERRSGRHRDQRLRDLGLRRRRRSANANTITDPARDGISVTGFQTNTHDGSQLDRDFSIVSLLRRTTTPSPERATTASMCTAPTGPTSATTRSPTPPATASRRTSPSTSGRVQPDHGLGRQRRHRHRRLGRPASTSTRSPAAVPTASTSTTPGRTYVWQNFGSPTTATTASSWPERHPQATSCTTTRRPATTTVASASPGPSGPATDPSWVAYNNVGGNTGLDCEDQMLGTQTENGTYAGTTGNVWWSNLNYGAADDQPVGICMGNTLHGERTSTTARWATPTSGPRPPSATAPGPTPGRSRPTRDGSPGTLPAGLTLNTSTGQITGTPTAGGGRASPSS